MVFIVTKPLQQQLPTKSLVEGETKSDSDGGKGGGAGSRDRGGSGGEGKSQSEGGAGKHSGEKNSGTVADDGGIGSVKEKVSFPQKPSIYRIAGIFREVIFSWLRGEPRNIYPRKTTKREPRAYCV